MRRKWLYLSILSYCIVLLLILIIGYAKNNTNYSGKSIQSALLNQKYTNAINKIQLEIPLEDSQYPATVVFLKKNEDSNDYWQGNTGNISFNADKSVMKELLGVFSATKDFIHLSDDISSWEQFGLSLVNAVHISFYESVNGNDTLRSDLYFGKNTTDYSGVYVRSGKNTSVYRIKNDFSSYLSPYIDFWADLSVFQTESANSLFQQESDVISVSVNLEDKKGTPKTMKIYANGTSEYTSYIHTLLSLNGSGIVSSNEPESLGISKKLEINATNQNSRSFSVVVYTTSDDIELGTRYFVQFKKDKDASFPNYFIEISAWTYKNLLPQSFM